MAPTGRAGGSAWGSGSAGSGDKAVAGLGSSRSAWAPAALSRAGFRMSAAASRVAVWNWSSAFASRGQKRNSSGYVALQSGQTFIMDLPDDSENGFAAESMRHPL